MADTGIRFGMTVLDTADPHGLADFYARLLGWEVVRSEDDWVSVRGDGGHLGFQLAPDHVPPTWPSGQVPQQLHLDLDVAAYEGTEQLALQLGATLVDDSPEHPTFRVYTDPAGHPFCLCLEGA